GTFSNRQPGYMFAPSLTRSTFPVSNEPCADVFAYDGERVYIRQASNVLIHGVDGALLGAFTIEHADALQNCAGPFLAANGRELWFVSIGDLTVHRYAVP
ncbi:MAG: hypothetical protein WCS01_12235, partial [bacterium]